MVAWLTSVSSDRRFIDAWIDDYSSYGYIHWAIGSHDFSRISFKVISRRLFAKFSPFPISYSNIDVSISVPHRHVMSITATICLIYFSIISQEGALQTGARRINFPDLIIFLSFLANTVDKRALDDFRFSQHAFDGDFDCFFWWLVIRNFGRADMPPAPPTGYYFYSTDVSFDFATSPKISFIRTLIDAVNHRLRQSASLLPIFSPTSEPKRYIDRF